MSDFGVRSAGPRRRGGGHGWALVVGLVALVTATVLLGGWLVLGQQSATSPAASPESQESEPSVSSGATLPAKDSPSAPATEPARIPPAAPRPSAPRSIDIPALAVTSDLVRLGLEEDRTVEVPQDAQKAGWYELGTSPGQRGSAVILGHVDSVDGPAVFSRLRELVPGDQVHVTLMDGTVETFEVSRLETIANDDFPAEQVYAGTPGRPTLNIVTCGGDYDAERGGYQSNVIAYTEHVSTQPAT